MAIFGASGLFGDARCIDSNSVLFADDARYTWFLIVGSLWILLLRSQSLHGTLLWRLLLTDVFPNLRPSLFREERKVRDNGTSPDAPYRRYFVMCTDTP